MSTGAGTDDAVKGPILATARAAMPDLEYMGLFRAKVVSQSGDLKTVDLEPTDPRLPLMSNIPLKVGIPGATAKIVAGAIVLVGWENGDPAIPQAFIFEQGAIVLQLTLSADIIQLGKPNLVPLVDGVVTGQGIDVFTGLPYWMLGNSSAAVGATKQ